MNKLLEFVGTELTKQPSKFLVLIRDKGNEVNRDKIRSSIATIIPYLVQNGKLQSVVDSMYDIVILITQQISLTKVHFFFYMYLNILLKLLFFVPTKNYLIMYYL